MKIKLKENERIDDLEIKNVRTFLDKLWILLNQKNKDIIQEITEKKALSNELIAKMNEAISEIKKAI